MSKFERWPKSVYSVGEDPDPRFSLANERTFLAWLSTAFGITATGLVIDAFHIDKSDSLRTATAVAFVLIGALVGIFAFLRWASAEKAMRLKQPLPSAHLKLFVLIATVLMAGAVIMLFLGKI